jgi:signal transduction histidine kinase/ActR/RegA family two-component response regulator
VHEGKDLHAVVMVLRDVTRERQLEKMKSDFISTVSHELRTPLTPVLGFAKLIQKAFNRNIVPALPPDEKAPHKAAERVNQNLDILIGEVNQLSKLVDDVLFLADLDAGRLKWRTEAVDMVQTLQEVTQEFRSQAEDKGLEIHLDCPADLPQVHGDRKRLERVIRNLLSNAVKFTDEGEIRVQAQAIQRQDGHWTTEPCVDVPQQLSSASYVLVAVRDTGPGISPETRQKLFERFGQGMHDILTEKPSGTGLGLALSKEIIGHHSGQIWVDSVPDQGSTFAFVLPLSTESSDGLLWGELISLPDTAPTILVVDDEPGVRELLSYILLRAGYRTLVAVDGPAALNMARVHKPDLIVLDIMIPGISGLDVTSVLKADESTRHIPIIILSVVANEERAIQLGADACFSKPFDRDALLERMGELLALHSAAKAKD